MKNIRVFLSENFQFLEVKFSIHLNRHVFVMRYWASLLCHYRVIYSHSNICYYSVIYVEMDSDTVMTAYYVHLKSTLRRNLSFMSVPFNVAVLVIIVAFHGIYLDKLYSVHRNNTYRVRSNYHSHPFKRTVKKFRSLQITASVLLLYLCLYKENQKKQKTKKKKKKKKTTTPPPPKKKENNKKTHNHHQLSHFLIFF